jgi:hypothetical protein
VQIPCHLLRQLEEPCITPSVLVDRGSSVIGKVEDIEFALAFAVDNPHAGRRMVQGVDHMRFTFHAFSFQHFQP